MSNLLPPVQAYVSHTLKEFPQTKWYEIYEGHGVLEIRVMVDMTKFSKRLMRELRGKLEPYLILKNPKIAFDFLYIPWSPKNIHQSTKKVH